MLKLFFMIYFFFGDVVPNFLFRQKPFVIGSILNPLPPFPPPPFRTCILFQFHMFYIDVPPFCFFTKSMVLLLSLILSCTYLPPLSLSLSLSLYLSISIHLKSVQFGMEDVKSNLFVQQHSLSVSCCLFYDLLTLNIFWLSLVGCCENMKTVKCQLFRIFWNCLEARKSVYYSYGSCLYVNLSQYIKSPLGILMNRFFFFPNWVILIYILTCQFFFSFLYLLGHFITSFCSLDLCIATAWSLPYVIHKATVNTYVVIDALIELVLRQKHWIFYLNLFGGKNIN